MLLKLAKNVDQQDQQFVDALRNLDGEIAQAGELARDFIAMVRKREASSLDGWLQRARQSPSAELRGLASSLRIDYAAVKAALHLPWSNGQTEGQVNRLKLLKRQMYGRANFDLLRSRVLLAA